MTTKVAMMKPGVEPVHSEALLAAREKMLPCTRTRRSSMISSLSDDRQRSCPPRRIRIVVAIGHLRDGRIHDGDGQSRDMRGDAGGFRLIDFRCQPHLHVFRVEKRD